LIILIGSYINKTYLMNREGAKGAKEEQEVKPVVFMFY